MGCSSLCVLSQITRVLNITFFYFQNAGRLTGLDFPPKIEAEQGPSGVQTMTQEPTSTIDQPLLDDKSSKNQGNVASGGNQLVSLFKYNMRCHSMRQFSIENFKTSI